MIKTLKQIIKDKYNKLSIYVNRKFAGRFGDVVTYGCALLVFSLLLIGSYNVNVIGDSSSDVMLSYSKALLPTTILMFKLLKSGRENVDKGNKDILNNSERFLLIMISMISLMPIFIVWSTNSTEYWSHGKFVSDMLSIIVTLLNITVLKADDK